MDVVSIDLGSKYASNLGLAGITEWDPEQATAAAEAGTKSQQSPQDVENGNNDGDQQQGKKKKKKKKKKKVRILIFAEQGECVIVFSLPRFLL